MAAYLTLSFALIISLGAPRSLAQDGDAWDRSVPARAARRAERDDERETQRQISSHVFSD